MLLDGSAVKKKHHAQSENDDQNDSPSSIQIAVIGGASSTQLSIQQQQRLVTGRRTSELKSEHQRGSTDSCVKSDALRHQSHRYDNNQHHQVSNDSNSNRSDSLQSVESALYSNHNKLNNNSTNYHYSTAKKENSTSQQNNSKQIKDKNQKDKTDSSNLNPFLELATSFAESNRQRKYSISGGYLHRHRQSVGTSRPSVAGLDANTNLGSSGLLRRRRAVEISDHKAVVLLHSKLKGMKLEDIA